MQVHCISISEHIWVGGCGPRGVGELPAGDIRASQGTFSSFLAITGPCFFCFFFCFFFSLFACFYKIMKCLLFNIKKNLG